MEEKGYSRAYSTGVTVASSTMGMIIPPSVPMVTYAMVSGVSIGQLFLGGLVPGLLIGVLQIVAVQITKRVGKFRLSEGGNMPRRSFLSETREGFFALVMPLIIIGSIVFGVATASESAGVAVLYALLLGFFVFRELKLRDLPELLRKTAASSASVMIIIGFSMIFGWIMAIEKVPDLIAGFFLSLQIDRFWILIMLDLLILFVGTFLDVTPALLLLTPILLPVAQHFGISGVQFGIIMVVGTAIGLVTPPLGMCLNAANKIARMPIVEIFVAAVPFLICNLIVLLLVTFVPEISLWLPSLMK
jgi:tripartite ATP-independent transporter DctM subunit